MRHCSRSRRFDARRSCFEVLQEARGETLAGHGDVELVVQLQRSVVEVRRAEHAPDAVDHDHLGVHHRRLVLVHLDAELEQALVVLARRVLHGHRVGDVPFDEDPDLDAAGDRVSQRPPRRFVRDEVRARDVDRLAGRGDRQQVELREVVAAAARRAPDGERTILLRAAPGARAIELRRHLAGRLAEVLVERPLQQAHDRAADPDVRVAPVLLALRVAEPVVGDADASGKPDLAVDDQDLAVAAVVHFLEGIPAQRVEIADAAPRALQALHMRVFHASWSRRRRRRC